MAVESQVTLTNRLRAYLEAWNGPDPAAVKDLYLDDATHQGPGVPMFYPDLSEPILRGAEAVRDFAALIHDADFSLDIVVTWVMEDASTSVVEYDVVRPEDSKIAEIILWEGDRVRQAHAYALRALG